MNCHWGENLPAHHHNRVIFLKNVDGIFNLFEESVRQMAHWLLALQSSKECFPKSFNIFRSSNRWKTVRRFSFYFRSSFMKFFWPTSIRCCDWELRRVDRCWSATENKAGFQQQILQLSHANTFPSKAALWLPMTSPKGSIAGPLDSLHIQVLPFQKFHFSDAPCMS